MRKLILMLILVIGGLITNAQSGFSEGRYYDQRYSISTVCGQTYTTIVGYNVYGNPIYAYWKNCRKAVWNSYYGQYTGYYWVWNGFQYLWQTRTEWRTWWYYNWQDYTIRVG